MPGLLEDTDPYASLIDKFAMQRKLLQNVQDYAQQVQQPLVQQAQQAQAAAPAMAAGLSGLLNDDQSEADRRRSKYLPASMALMGLGSGLLTNPWYGGGLGMGLQNAQQGLLGAYQMQRQQQTAKQQQLKNLIELQRAAAEARGPQPMTIGGKQGVYEPRHGFKYAPQEKPTSEPLEKVDTPQGPMYIPRSQAAGMVPYEKPSADRYVLSVDNQGKPVYQLARPGLPGYDKGTMGTSAETIGDVVEGLRDGTIPPSMLSKRNTKGEYTKILSEAHKQGIDMSKLERDYQAAKKFAGSMNSQQMIRYKGLANSVVNTIDEVATLADQLKQSGITPLNRVSLEAKMRLAGNTPQGQLATRYMAAVNTLKEEFANLAQGGYAPTEAVWSLANRQINENFGVDQMHASLTELRRLINYRTQAFEELTPMYGYGRTGGQGPGGGSPIVHSSDKPLTPEEARQILQKMGQ